MEYTYHRLGDQPWAIHILRVDRTRPEFTLRASLALDTVFGLESVRAQVEATPPELGEVVAAVNGDFFIIRSGPYRGDPIGLMITDGELVSAPIGVSFWVSPRGEPRLSEVYSHFRAEWVSGEHCRFGLNQRRADDQAVLYTPRCGASTRTTGGREIVLEAENPGLWLPLQAQRRYVARVVAVREGGNAPIPDEGMVLSLGPQLVDRMPPTARGDHITLFTRTAPSLEGVSTAIGGGPILIHEGTKGHWDPPGPRHPRTAIGWNDDSFFFFVVDGRQAGLSIGMTYPEMADWMERLGCTEAMNLDGGGSSTLWLGGCVMNSPSDGRERWVANSLMLLRREPERTPASP